MKSNNFPTYINSISINIKLLKNQIEAKFNIFNMVLSKRETMAWSKKSMKEIARTPAAKDVVKAGSRLLQAKVSSH